MKTTIAKIIFCIVMPPVILGIGALTCLGILFGNTLPSMLVPLLGLFYLYFVYWLYQAVLQKKLEKLLIILACAIVLAGSSLLYKSSYTCDTSYDVYQARGWPLNMIQTSGINTSCEPRNLERFANTFFWYTVVAAAEGVIQYNRKKA